MIAYTIGFGVLLVAGLLLIILGFDVLDSPIVVILSTVIPLSLSLGLVWEHLAEYRILYLVFAILGFLAIIITRSIPMKNKLPVLVLAVVHGIAGMTIFLLPFFLAFTGRAAPGFALVGLGGALIGLGGLLLSFLKAGKPILSRNTILKILPGLLLVDNCRLCARFFSSLTFLSWKQTLWNKHRIGYPQQRKYGCISPPGSCGRAWVSCWSSLPPPGWVLVHSWMVLLLILAGLLLAAGIYFFGFSKLASRNVQRIINIPKERVCLFAFQKWTSYPLVLVMIAMGIYLRLYSPIPKPYLAILYLGLGASLFASSLQYYSQVLRTTRT